MLYVLVLIGGATRLTESGLSITEWKPVTGVIPPLSQAAWTAEFAKYRRIPEYRAVHAGMTLAGFRRIYLWEYGHRLWARLLGLAFAVPLAVFALRGELSRPLRRRLALLLCLLAAQGFLGWYMVQSGLAERTDVSQYRLASHLGLALVIYAVAVWTAARLLWPRPRSAGGPAAAVFRPWAAAVLALAFVTALSGAFVAGLDAGRIFNTFPLMAGQLVPPGWGVLTPWYRNVFENPVAVQFDHRALGTTLVTVAILGWIGSRRMRPFPGRRLLDLLLLAALAQASLGIGTLLLHVPVPVAVLHQGGAVLVLTAALLTFHGLGGSSGSRDRAVEVRPRRTRSHLRFSTPSYQAE